MANYNQNSKLSQRDKDAAKEQFRAKNPMTSPKPKMQPYAQEEKLDSKNLKGQSYQRAKGIMQRAIASRSKKSKMMEEGADYWMKKDRDQLGY
jgi:hypothetical protein